MRYGLRRLLVQVVDIPAERRNKFGLKSDGMSEDMAVTLGDMFVVGDGGVLGGMSPESGVAFGTEKCYLFGDMLVGPWGM
jgi:hypothetical protein